MRRRSAGETGTVWPETRPAIEARVSIALAKGYGGLRRGIGTPDAASTTVASSRNEMARPPTMNRSPLTPRVTAASTAEATSRASTTTRFPGSTTGISPPSKRRSTWPAGDGPRSFGPTIIAGRIRTTRIAGSSERIASIAFSASILLLK